MIQLITYLTIRIKTTLFSRLLCQFQFAGLWREKQDLAFFHTGSYTDSLLHRLDYPAEIYKELWQGIKMRKVMTNLSKKHSKNI
jgi:hypothetical protein